jgi:hypothetical protein
VATARAAAVITTAPDQGRSGGENWSTARATAARMSSATTVASGPMMNRPMIPYLVPLE